MGLFLQRAAVPAAGLLLGLAGCTTPAPVDVPDDARGAAVEVQVAGVADGGELPADLTCDGAGGFPSVGWGALPPQTQAVAVVVYDPDAPGGDYLHRVVTNLDPDAGELPGAATPAGALELPTSAGAPGWVPPCPPAGDDPHRYVFVVYALDRPTRLPTTAQPQTVVATVTEAAVGEGRVTATFSR